jgi:hypothetical protein
VSRADNIVMEVEKADSIAVEEVQAVRYSSVEEQLSV